ncbi:MAG: hypothetical protein C0617_01865 [Desulfuromonas sp.]|uniref:Crp/Fnr family transcriptional regulator n=1 Tax=Desulfuromonas sp. TaxID=892 RepID=UPI000CAF142F|nr:cyclic nucleotide-binding domain-containing protein [Desulfuromonas sp.]PLX86131.1 MAG: hypothetical protein C0617_01865 [Desulfuromonas sp.]
MSRQSGDRFETFRGSALLRNLDEGEIEALDAICSEKRIDEGATVFVENMPGESLYMVREGTIKVSKMLAEGEERIIIILGPEDVFGEMALLDGGARTATARVIEAASLLVLKKEDFDALCERNPALGIKLMRNIVQALSQRIRENAQEYRHMLLLALGEEA